MPEWFFIVKEISHNNLVFKGKKLLHRIFVALPENAYSSLTDK